MKDIKGLLKAAVYPRNWKPLYKQYKELFRYIFFGILTTIVSFGTYFLFRFMFPNAESVPKFLRWSFYLADLFGGESKTVLPNLLSWICSVLFAYLTNRKWVFESKAKGFISVINECIAFFAARFFTLCVDLSVMYLLVDVTGIREGWYEFGAKLASNVLVLVLNYILSKLFVFRRKNGKEDIELFRPRLRDWRRVLGYRREFRRNNETMHGSANFDHIRSYFKWYLRTRKLSNKKIPPLEGFVHSDTYLAFRDKDVVGMVSVRHELNENLEKIGGHIGYSVRKSERGNGYAKWMLKLALDRCEDIGIKKALLTCEKENVASARVIKANGGVFQDEIFIDDMNIQRYWIPLGEQRVIPDTTPK